MLTIPIANRALSDILKGLDVFTKSAKSFDLAFREIKIKTKYKSFGYVRKRKRKVSLPALLAIAEPISAISQKLKKKIKTL